MTSRVSEKLRHACRNQKHKAPSVCKIVDKNERDRTRRRPVSISFYSTNHSILERESDLSSSRSSLVFVDHISYISIWMAQSMLLCLWLQSARDSLLSSSHTYIYTDTHAVCAFKLQLYRVQYSLSYRIFFPTESLKGSRSPWIFRVL